MVHIPHPAHRWRVPLVAVLGALAVIIAVVWLRGRGSSRGAQYKYETAVVDRGPIRAKVTATGTVNPIVQVQVGSQVSGRIEKLGADFNSEVQPGQMIAQIDPRLFQAAVDQAKANLIAAQANTRKAQAQLVDLVRTAQRNKLLWEQNLLAKATADTSEANAEVARAQVEQAKAAEIQAKAALDSAQLNLSYTTIRSPIHGTVITRNIDVGQTVAASFNAPLLFLIGEDLTKMEVDTNIAEADVGALERGLVATFTVDAYPARVFRGTIRQVRKSPQVIQNVVTYNAVIDVANPDLALRPGMTANIEIIYADKPDVIRVPNAAVRFRAPTELSGGKAIVPPQGKKLVWVLRANVPTAVTFEAGVTDGTNTEVKSGLAEGDVVITEASGGRQRTAARMP